jgi:O-antigen/teichoic acid export membrane protein
MKSIRYFKGLSWLIVLNMLVKPVWLFFIDRQVQNIVGYEEYGKYFAILNLSYVLFFLSDAGISNMLNQRMANQLAINILQLLRIKLFLLLTYFIVFCFVGWLTHISQWNIVFCVIAIQALTSLLIFFRNIITANQFFSVDAWLSVIDKTLMIIFCGSTIYASLGKISLLLFLQIQIGCTAIAVILSFLVVIKNKLVVVTGKEKIESILKQVLPFTLIILLMSVHYRLDGFLLERIHLHGALEAGIYASAYRLLDASNMVGYLASSFLVAFVARNIGHRKMLEDAIFNTRHVMIFLSMAAVSFVMVFAQWLQQLLYHSGSSYHVLVMQLCIATYPAYCLVHVYGSVLTGAARFKQFIMVLVLSVIINIVLNVALIPLYGALGCCIAALVSQYFCGVMTLMIATKAVSIGYNVKSVFIYLLCGFLLVALFQLGKYALINVWVILSIAVLLTVFLLSTQISFFKKYFVSFR